MTRTRRRAAISFWALLLLVLAVSPLTAPFSSCTLGDLLSDRDVQAAAILQAKTAKDESSAATPATPPTLAFCPTTAPAASAPIRCTHRRATLDIPLRI